MIDYELSDEMLYKAMPDVETLLLSKLPEQIPEHSFSRRFERRMRKLIQSEKRSPQMRGFIKQAKHVAVIILAILVMSFGTVMSVQALRVQFFRLITQAFERYTSVTFEQTGSELIQNEDFVLYQISDVPQGFKKAEELCDPDAKINYVTYRNESGSKIEFSQESLETVSMSVNTEGVSHEKTEINGCEAYYYSNIGMQSVYWFDDEYLYMVTSDLDKYTVLKLAKSTKIAK